MNETPTIEDVSPGERPKLGRPKETPAVRANRRLREADESAERELSEIDARLDELRKPERDEHERAAARRREISTLERARGAARERRDRERGAVLEDEAEAVWNRAVDVQTRLLGRLEGVAEELAELEQARSRWLALKLEAQALVHGGRSSPFAAQNLHREWTPGGRLGPTTTRAAVRGYYSLLGRVIRSFRAYRDGGPSAGPPRTIEVLE